MNTLKITTLSLVAVAALSLTGCGSSSSSSTPATTSTPATDLTTVDTAYDYFVKNNKIDIKSAGSITYNSTSAATGVDESKIWKGTPGSMAPIENVDGNASTKNIISGKTRVDITKDITQDTNWTSNNVYVLHGHIKVENSKLKLEPGTVVAGLIPNSYLLIDKSSTIDANGTLAHPITFTSLKDANGTSTENSNGEWGGLILVGQAYAHYSGNTYEADPTVSFGSTGHTHDADSSGILNYVAVKHSGYAVQINKELNGLSLCAVGSGTTLTNIAIIGGSDDGMEAWGGTANFKNLYVYNAQDDSTDTDLGYRGKLENVLARQVRVDSTNNHDSSCMEFGNDNNTIVTDDSNATQPTAINYTCYSRGGGFYNKNDAGAIWNNVKFISEKTKDYELVHFRSADAYTTGAKHITGPVSFYNKNVVYSKDNTYTKKNSKVQ